VLTSVQYDIYLQSQSAENFLSQSWYIYLPRPFTVQINHTDSAQQSHYIMCTQHPIQRVLVMLPLFKAAGAWHWRVAFYFTSCECMELYIHSRMMASLRCTEFSTWWHCLSPCSVPSLRLWHSSLLMQFINSKLSSAHCCFSRFAEWTAKSSLNVTGAQALCVLCSTQAPQPRTF